jgi:hypothetical protein
MIRKDSRRLLLRQLSAIAKKVSVLKITANAIVLDKNVTRNATVVIVRTV